MWCPALLILAFLGGVACLVIRFQSVATPEPEIIDYTPVPADLNVPSQEMMQCINDYRKEKGLSRLKSDQAATALADEHLDYCLMAGKISHDNIAYRIEDLMVRGANMVSENVAMKYLTTYGTFQAYLNSERHRKNIENRYYTHVGIASIKHLGTFWNVIVFVEFKK